MTNVISGINIYYYKSIRKHFGGVYTGRIDDLWEEVLTYIDNTYEIDKVKKYIS